MKFRPCFLSGNAQKKPLTRSRLILDLPFAELNPVRTPNNANVCR